MQVCSGCGAVSWEGECACPDRPDGEPYPDLLTLPVKVRSRGRTAETTPDRITVTVHWAASTEREGTEPGFLEHGVDLDIDPEVAAEERERDECPQRSGEPCLPVWVDAVLICYHCRRPLPSPR